MSSNDNRTQHQAGAELATPAGAPRNSLDRVLELQRAVGNRAVTRLLARRTLTEREWAATHEGRVEDTHRFLGDIPPWPDPHRDRPVTSELSDEYVLWNFLVGDETLRKGHRAGLRSVALRWSSELAADPSLRIRVLGYASTSGSGDLNERLARRRAEATRNFLVKAGVPQDRIDIDSSGSRLPLDPDQGPENLAHNRRVEVSKFVASTDRKDLADLAKDTSVTITSAQWEGRRRVAGVGSFSHGDGLHWTVTEDDVTVGFQAGTLRIDMGVQSSDPGVEVGLVQFLTTEARQANYAEPLPGGRMPPSTDPPAAVLDYDGCLNAFAPLRDVVHARDAFSEPQATVSASQRAGQATTPVLPEAVLPRRIDIPGRGPGSLRGLLWNLEYVIVLIARRGDLIVPIGYTPIQMQSSANVYDAGWQPPGTLIPEWITEAFPLSDPEFTRGAPPGLDIEHAMSMPTRRLREEMIARHVARPRITVAAKRSTWGSVAAPEST